MDLDQKRPGQKEIFASEHGSGGILLEWLNRRGKENARVAIAVQKKPLRLDQFLML